MRNVLKLDIPETYYHVYARGVSKQPIFTTAEDFETFLNLFKRYLSLTPSLDNSGREYPHLHSKVELLSYCLMGNHFHLLLYQAEERAMSSLMRGVMSSYSRYFNLKYGRSGPLFESRYKASMILHPSYLEHISRYIHLNPKDWKTYPYSSIHAYLGKGTEEWLQSERILALFSSRGEYVAFMHDYESNKAMLEELKSELAEV